MKFSYTVPFDQPASATWAALQDPVQLIRCLPGCEGVDRAGSDGFRVRLSTGLGPVRLTVEGTANLTYDPERRTLVAHVNLGDGYAGSIHGTFHLAAADRADLGSELRLDADVVLGGKLGEFAQPLLRRRADQTVREFGENLKRLMA